MSVGDMLTSENNVGKDKWTHNIMCNLGATGPVVAHGLDSCTSKKTTVNVDPGFNVPVLGQVGDIDGKTLNETKEVNRRPIAEEA